MDEEIYQAARPLLSAGAGDTDGANAGNTQDSPLPPVSDTPTTEGTGFTEEPTEVNG